MYDAIVCIKYHPDNDRLNMHLFCIQQDKTAVDLAVLFGNLSLLYMVRKRHDEVLSISSAKAAAAATYAAERAEFCDALAAFSDSNSPCFAKFSFCEHEGVSYVSNVDLTKWRLQQHDETLKNEENKEVSHSPILETLAFTVPSQQYRKGIEIRQQCFIQ